MSHALLAGFDPLTLVSVTTFLQRRGFVVQTAQSALKSREALRNGVDLLLLDMDMPEYDAAALADIAHARKIPFAVALADNGERSPLLPSDAHFMIKPLTPPRLEAMLAVASPNG